MDQLLRIWVNRFTSYSRTSAEALKTLPAYIWLTLGVVFVVALPVILTDMPPLVDYPNHMVRFWLLSGGASHGPVSSYFQIDWSHTATNIGMDVMATVLGVFSPAHITGRIILAAAALLPAFGACLVSRRLYGRLSYWHILIFLNAWTLVLLTGFMSFQLGLGAALVCLWLDLKLGDQAPGMRYLRQSLQVLVVVLFHPFGALFYLVLATGIALGDKVGFRPDRQGARETLKRIGLAWLPFVIALGLMGLRIKLLGNGAPPGQDEGLSLDAFSWYDPGWDHMGIDHVFWSFVGPYRSYSLPVDLIFVGLLCLPILTSAWQKSLRFHGGLVVVGIGLFLIGVVAPQGIDTTSMVDVRLWTMSALIMAMAVLPQVEFGRRTATVLCSLALLVLGARSMWLTWVWQQRQSDVRSLYSALDLVPEGKRIAPLAVEVGNPDAEPVGRYLGGMTTTYGHLPTLAVMRREDYVPTVFSESGKQPLKVLPPYISMHETTGGLLGTVYDLKANNADAAVYLENWIRDFDYVLILNADMNRKESQIDQHACLVSDKGFAKLYRVHREPGPCDTPPRPDFARSATLIADSQ